MSAAGDRARAHIRRNRREFELVALSGAFGPVKVAHEETIEEFAEMIGCTVEDVIAGEMAAREARNADDDEDGDETVWNPPAGASWVDDRTTPLRRVPS